MQSFTTSKLIIITLVIIPKSQPIESSPPLTLALLSMQMICRLCTAVHAISWKLFTFGVAHEVKGSNVNDEHPERRVSIDGTVLVESETESTKRAQKVRIAVRVFDLITNSTLELSYVENLSTSHHR